MEYIDEKSPYEIKPLSQNQNFSIPIKYVCISPCHMMSVLNDELGVSVNNIKFEFLDNIDILKKRKVEIKPESITKIQCSKTNCLLKLSLTTDAYKKYFKDEQEDLFRNTIWLCLNFESIEIYNTKIKSLSEYYPSSEICAKDYRRFKNRLYKCDTNKEFVTDWASCVTDVSKMNMVPVPTIDDTTCNNPHTPPKTNPSSPLCDIKFSPEVTDVMEQVKEKNKRRPLKRSTDAPLVPAKKQRVSSQINRKLLYSPSPKHSMEITDRDLLCLQPRMCLNDNVINVYLTYIYHEVLTQDQREAAHFFNVFFNTKLIGSVAQQEVDTPTLRHARVAKWTKDVDIFSKDFIVIPIIEDDHWFLVIVCFPWMCGFVNYMELFNGRNSGPTTIPKNTSVFATKTRYLKIVRMKQKKVKAMPCILVLDSLDAKNRNEKVNIIRDYLKSEWDSKRLAKDGPLIFDKTTCRGYCPVVLKQDNGTDSGVYLLQNVESFFKNSLKSYDREVFKDGLNHWFDRDHIEAKRKEIRDTILEKSKEVFS